MTPGYNDLFAAVIPPQEVELNDKHDWLWCNLYSCLQQQNNEPFSNDPLDTSTCHAIFSAVKRNYQEPLSPPETLITVAGDWGIKSVKPTRKRTYNYALAGASPHGPFLVVDIDSVLNNFTHWFTTNLKEDLHDRIYPLPLGIHASDWMASKTPSISELRNIEKTNLCYANFSITHNQRMTIAEWAVTQPYIDCLFPKRYPNQDVDLDMNILTEERLSISDLANKLASYHFAICPTGNGLDTHRIWECILTNTVPIAHYNFANLVFSQIWPMILVHRYEQTDIFHLMQEFTDKHGQTIEYDYQLLLKENLPGLMEKIKYESNRLRRQTV